MESATERHTRELADECYDDISASRRTIVDKSQPESGAAQQTCYQDVHELVFGAFEYCIGLETVMIPKSVEFIGYDVFRGCEKLTIHAPAGSYAEQFAKENGIPIVLE